MAVVSYSDFTNIGKPWEPSDDEQLIKLYNEDQKDILQIAAIFKRAPGGIAARLKKLNIIEDNKSARGYEEYKNSDLYKEACELSRNRHKKEKTKDKPEDDIIKSFNKVNKNMVTLQKKLDNYNQLKDQIEKLTEENNNLKHRLSTNDEYETIVIKDKEYFLIDNQVYKINKIKGELYGNYNPEKNKVTKIKTKDI
jgi:predicted nuclease with TOPRIM domain